MSKNVAYARGSTNAGCAGYFESDVHHLKLLVPTGSNIGFSYRVVAKRRGFEDVRMAQMKGETPERVAAQVESDPISIESDKAAMENDRTQQIQISEKRAEEEKLMPMRNQR